MTLCKPLKMACGQRVLHWFLMRGLTLWQSPTTLDAMDEKSAWYLQLRIADSEEGGKSIARAYTANGQPEAGQSRTEIEFRRSPLQKAVYKTGEAAGKAYDASVASLK